MAKKRRLDNFSAVGEGGVRTTSSAVKNGSSLSFLAVPMSNWETTENHLFEKQAQNQWLP
jgi:hypothetical protein